MQEQQTQVSALLVQVNEATGMLRDLGAWRATAEPAANAAARRMASLEADLEDATRAVASVTTLTL